ncbi:MAG: glutamine-synthetase adenylyltransferase, partial [Arenimonas sp.]|nr:glutamine-synthetase adenylyltransferase [Arenimonas sp.]
MASEPTLDDATDKLVERALARLAERAPAAAVQARRPDLATLAIASDFAIDTLVRQPALLDTLDDPLVTVPDLGADAAADWPSLLRRWRARQSTRLVWRDVMGVDEVDATLAGASRIADQALQAGVQALIGPLEQA